MGTVFTTKLTRQKHLFAAILILLWLLVVCFMGLRFWLVTSNIEDGDLATKLLLFDDIFFVVIVVTTILISIIGVIVARLYSSLHLSVEQIDHEHERALRQEQDKIRMKRQLTNNINHELKTPICSIIGYLEMILNNEELDKATIRNFAQKSYLQAERLRRLVLDLSTITRIDEASSMIECEELDLSTLIDNIVDDTMPQAENQNISVISSIETKLPINGNQMLLYSVFRNLVDNSIAYSGGRQVFIELLETKDDMYHFKIRDNGIGIESKHLPYIFERFYRVDAGRSRKIGGTGLGLSIVKNAILFHGGTIYAQKAKAGGVEFLFTLKISQ